MDMLVSIEGIPKSGKTTTTREVEKLWRKAYPDRKLTVLSAPSDGECGRQLASMLEVGTRDRTGLLSASTVDCAAISCDILAECDKTGVDFLLDSWFLNYATHQDYADRSDLLNTVAYFESMFPVPHATILMEVSTDVACERIMHLGGSSPNARDRERIEGIRSAYHFLRNLSKIDAIVDGTKSVADIAAESFSLIENKMFTRQEHLWNS